MGTLQKLTNLSLVLAVITLLGYFFSSLALMDIYHNNEPNLGLEWNIVRATFLFTLIFIAVSSVTIWKLKKKS